MGNGITYLKLNIYGEKKVLQVKRQSLKSIRDLVYFIKQTKIDSLEIPHQIFFRGKVCYLEDQIPEEAFAIKDQQFMGDSICIFQSNFVLLKGQHMDFFTQRGISIENLLQNQQLDAFLEILRQNSTYQYHIDGEKWSFMQKSLHYQPVTLASNIVYLAHVKCTVYQTETILYSEQYSPYEIYVNDRKMKDLKLIITPHFYDSQTEYTKRKYNFEQAIRRNLSDLIYVSKLQNYEKRSHFFGAIATETFWIFTLYIKPQERSEMICEKNFQISELIFLKSNKEDSVEESSLLKKLLETLKVILLLEPNQIYINENEIVVFKSYPKNLEISTEIFQKIEPYPFPKYIIEENKRLEDIIKNKWQNPHTDPWFKTYYTNGLDTLLKELWKISTKEVEIDEQIDLLFTLRKFLTAFVHNVILLAQIQCPNFEITSFESIYNNFPHFLVKKIGGQEIRLVITLWADGETESNALERNVNLINLISLSQIDKIYFGAIVSITGWNLTYYRRQVDSQEIRAKCCLVSNIFNTNIYQNMGVPKYENPQSFKNLISTLDLIMRLETSKVIQLLEKQANNNIQMEHASIKENKPAEKIIYGVLSKQNSNQDLQFVKSCTDQSPTDLMIDEKSEQEKYIDYDQSNSTLDSAHIMDLKIKNVKLETSNVCESLNQLPKRIKRKAFEYMEGNNNPESNIVRSSGQKAFKLMKSSQKYIQAKLEESSYDDSLQ